MGCFRIALIIRWSPRGFGFGWPGRRCRGGSPNLTVVKGMFFLLRLSFLELGCRGALEAELAV